MSLNDRDVQLGGINDLGDDEFDNEIQDEDLSIYPPPGVEIGALRLAVDRGSGSFAEDGRLEVAEDRTMMDGETQLGSGNIAVEGPTEIGYDDIGAASAADRMASEIGAAAAADRYASEIGYGPASMRGQSEIGSSVMHDPMRAAEEELSDPFESFMLMPTRLGADVADRGYASEIGSAAMYGPTEIGESDEERERRQREEYPYPIGAAEAADRPGSEIFGVSPAAAVAKVIEKARDNRQPAPPMRAVDVEAPLRDDGDDWALTDTFIGAAVKTGVANPFPLTSQLLVRAGATTEPRFVRVDTEKSYTQFRTENSPELAELKARLEAHIADPHAHGGGGAELSSDAADLSEDIEDLVILGAEVQEAEAKKRVELWMPRRFDGKITAWREGDFVCASLILPGADGEVRICTSLEPIRKCVEEMSRHAAESGVPAATVVGVLPAMGCVLGAGTALKEMAAAAPAILQRPEAAGKQPFMVRIEPKTSPALAALSMLVVACKQGNAQACDEWRRLGELSAGPVKQAMLEAVQIVKAAA